MQIHQSAEDYLECILKLSKQRPVVRSIDIANDMNYSKPSISVAMKNLRLNGYIKMAGIPGNFTGDGRTGCVQD